MPLITTLIAHILPLYALIALGFAAGRWAGVERKSIAVTLFYFITPVVFFAGILHAHVNAALFLIPVATYALSCAMCGLSYGLASLCFTDSRRNILAMAGGTANTGYFGLPIAMLLFTPSGVAMYMTGMVGISVFEATLGYYVAARGQFTRAQALKRVATMPLIYAFLLAALAGYCGFTAPEPVEAVFTHLRGAYVVLGMMVIGLGLSSLTTLSIDWPFTFIAFATKFLAWPLAAYALVGLDSHLLHLFTPEMHRATLLLSCMPMAANAVVFATLLNVEPEKVATAVLISTLLAIGSVPLMAAWLL